MKPAQILVTMLEDMANPNPRGGPSIVDLFLGLSKSRNGKWEMGKWGMEMGKWGMELQPWVYFNTSGEL